MPHPKKRKTKSGKNQRRSHHALNKISLVECEKCGKTIKPHRACSSCGYYKGRKVIDVLKNLSKKEKALAEKLEKKEEEKDKKVGKK